MPSYSLDCYSYFFTSPFTSYLHITFSIVNFFNEIKIISLELITFYACKNFENNIPISKMQSDPRSQNLYLTLYYSTISIRLYVKSLEIRIQNRYSKKKSIVNKYCRRSNPNGENLPCFERERVKKIREKKEGRLFIIMMKKKKRAQTFLLDVRESLRVLLMY